MKVEVKAYPPINLDPLKPHALEVLDTGLELMDCKHWISSGTLLGLYRDKRLIPHDTDLDVNVLDSPFVKLPFRLIRTQHYAGRVMQTAYEHRDTIFDIYYFYTGFTDGHATNFNDEGVIEKPLRFIENIGVLKHQGKDYPVPTPIEEFLEWRFKDWKTPTTEKLPWTEDANHLKGTV